MIKQNPFSLYDFLGYFIPGALLIYLYLFIEYFNSLNGRFEFISFLKESDSPQIEKFLFFIIVSYALGHLINFTSSITIEKYANWIYDYPSKYLLNLVDERVFWKTLNFRRILTVIFIFPIMILDLILGNIFNFKKYYTRKLDNFLIEIIRGKGLLLINQIFKDIEKTDQVFELRSYDFHRIFAHHTFENSKNHQFKLVNYVVLYGFLRSMSLISVIVFWFLIHIKFVECNDNITYMHLLTTGLISYIFFMAFMKFYRRYTLEGLMLIAIDKDIN